MLDVPSSGTGWITFGVTPTFPFAATFQWFASLALCISTIIALSTEHPPRDIELILALVPTQCFAIVTFASIFFRTNPQPFLALGVGGIRAFLATNDASGWQREVRILPWASVVQTEHRADRVDLVEARNGGYVRASLGLPRLAAATSAVIQGQIQDAVRRAHGAAPAATENEVLGRLAPYPDEPPEAWRARLELAVTTGGYRGGDRDVGAWSDALVDPDAPPNVRVAAGFLLTRVAPERTAEITHLLEDLRDDEARVLARTLLDGLSGKTCG